MTKPVFGLVLGGVLGALDGLSALVSAPETRTQIVGIVIGSTFKGVIAGLLIGWYAKRKPSLGAALMFGLVVGAILATIIAAMPNPEPFHYTWQIILPGALVGLIVGYATQKYGAPGPGTATAQ